MRHRGQLPADRLPDGVRHPPRADVPRLGDGHLRDGVRRPGDLSGGPPEGSGRHLRLHRRHCPPAGRILTLSGDGFAGGRRRRAGRADVRRETAQSIPRPADEPRHQSGHLSQYAHANAQNYELSCCSNHTFLLF